jgi:hypothetical protein
MPTQPGICDDSYANVVDARVIPLAGDVFGELSTGEINIACAGVVLGHVLNRDNIVVQGLNKKFQCTVFLDTPDEGYLSPDNTVYLLPLIGGKQGTRMFQDGEWFEPKLVQGMVLRRTSSGIGEFRRIGAFKCEQRQALDDGVGGNTYHEFMRSLESSGQGAARSVCAKVVRDAEHSKEVFTIIIV